MSLYVFLVFINSLFILRSYAARNFMNWKSCDKWTLWDTPGYPTLSTLCVCAPRENAGRHRNVIDVCG